jgi:hypothetical protein
MAGIEVLIVSSSGRTLSLPDRVEGFKARSLPCACWSKTRPPWCELAGLPDGPG